MSNHRISIDTSVGGATLVDNVKGLANDPDALSRIAEFIQDVASGTWPAKIRWNGNAVQAAGTIAFASFADSDTVTINGVTLTGKTTPSGTQQWAVGTSDEACANNLVTKINASALDKIVGVVAANRRSTITISSVIAGDTVTINSIVFTCVASRDGGDRRQFLLGPSDTVTAENLKTAITDLANAFPASLDGITVTRSTNVLTLNYKGSLTISQVGGHATLASATVVITSLVPGQIGNLCTLAISAHGSVVSPSGGTEGTEVIFSKTTASVSTL